LHSPGVSEDQAGILLKHEHIEVSRSYVNGDLRAETAILLHC